MKTEFLTPVGRLLQGDPFTPSKTDMAGNPLTIKNGPNAGQPTQRYVAVVGFAKNDPAFAPLWQKIEACGKAGFPAMTIAPFWDPNCRFAWKLMDGDGVDGVGKPNSVKEGFAGHWIVKFSSSFAPRCFHAGHYAPHEQIQDPKTIRRGYFVRIAGTVEPNMNTTKPGVFLNFSMLELAGVGPEITSGPDASSIFGSVAGVLPAGASPLPMHAGVLPGTITPQGVPLGMPGMMPPAPAQGLPMLAQAQELPAVMPGLPQPPAAPMAVMPNPGFLQGPPGMPGMMPQQTVGVGMPGLPPPPMSMMQPAAPQMTAKAGGYTYEQYRGQGYTDEILRAQGLMI